MSGFYKGIQANICRASVLTATEMGTYDSCKTLIRDTGIADEGLGLHFFSAFITGFFMTCTGCPFDLMRTRLMN
jgi:hypothetical protein